MPDIGMNAPVYSGLPTGALSVTKAGANAGFGYLNGSFPFSGGSAGPAPFGYLAEHVPGGGATPCSTRRSQVRPAAPPWCGNTTTGGRQQLGIGFGYGSFQAQFRYLAHGIVSRVTRGVNLGNWRNYLDPPTTTCSRQLAFISG